MRYTILFSILALAVLSTSFLYSAEGHLKALGTTFTVRTGTEYGDCLTTVYEDGNVELRCSDSFGNEASANTTIGCDYTSGKGLCAEGTPDLDLNASNQLKCKNGDVYNVSTGTTGGECNHSPIGDSINCIDGENYSEADCDHGCGTTKGAGCCCQDGTTGCGPGKNCTGK